MEIKRVTVATAPVRSEYISWAQFAELTGVHPSLLGELIELGWLVPVKTTEEHYLFTSRDVYRTRKLDRLCRDLELSSVSGTIVVDLLDRIEYLEQKVRDLERLLP